MVLSALVPSAVPLGALVDQCGVTSAPNNQKILLITMIVIKDVRDMFQLK